MATNLTLETDKEIKNMNQLSMIDTTITRPLANYHSSVWKNYFLSYTPQLTVCLVFFEIGLIDISYICSLFILANIIFIVFDPKFLLPFICFLFFVISFYFRIYIFFKFFFCVEEFL